MTHCTAKDNGEDKELPFLTSGSNSLQWRKWVHQIYFRYQLETTTYVLDPWEKFIFNGCVLALSVGTGYVGWIFYSALMNST